MPGTLTASSYPGARLDWPAKGGGSLAPLGRRGPAIILDCGCAVVIAIAFFSYDPLATTVIFLIVQILFIPTIGGSPGHRLFGMRVQRVTGGWPGLWRPIVRSVLLSVVIPAVIWDADNRGVHDKEIGRAHV